MADLGSLICPECKANKKRTRADQRFCSNRCRSKYFQREMKQDAKEFRLGHNRPPDHRENFIAKELERVIAYLCWYHGLEKDHPYIQEVLKAAKSANGLLGVQQREERQQPLNIPKRPCRLCGMMFDPRREWQWFCSPKCDEIDHAENVRQRQA